MEQLIILAVQQHAWGVLAAIFGTWLASGLLNLALAKRTQIDDWCEANPKAAAVLKLLRGIGVDPWAIAQAWALARDKKLPEYQKQTLEELKAKKAAKPPILPVFLIALVLGLLVVLCGGCRQTLPPKYSETPCDPETALNLGAECPALAGACGLSGVPTLAECTPYQECKQRVAARKKECTP